MVRPWVKKALLIAIAAFIVAQVFPVTRDNPQIDASKTLYSAYPMPTDLQAIFERSCRDCHSNRTTWPWYSRFAPVSWKVADDVHQGRRHFNISEWGTYPDEKQNRKSSNDSEIEKRPRGKQLQSAGKQKSDEARHGENCENRIVLEEPGRP